MRLIILWYLKMSEKFHDIAKELIKISNLLKKSSPVKNMPVDLGSIEDEIKELESFTNALRIRYEESNLWETTISKFSDWCWSNEEKDWQNLLDTVSKWGVEKTDCASDKYLALFKEEFLKALKEVNKKGKNYIWGIISNIAQKLQKITMRDKNNLEKMQDDAFTIFNKIKAGKATKEDFVKFKEIVNSISFAMSKLYNSRN